MRKKLVNDKGGNVSQAKASSLMCVVGNNMVSINLSSGTEAAKSGGFMQIVGSSILKYEWHAISPSRIFPIYLFERGAASWQRRLLEMRNSRALSARSACGIICCAGERKSAGRGESVGYLSHRLYAVALASGHQPAALWRRRLM